MISIFLVFDGVQVYPAVCIIIVVLGMFVFNFIVSIACSVLNIAICTADYLNICRGICVSFDVLICSVCKYRFPIQHRVRSCFHL